MSEQDEILQPEGAEEFVAKKTGEKQIPKEWSKDIVSTQWMQELLEAAEQNGERILEVPINLNLSFTVKVPESIVVTQHDIKSIETIRDVVVCQSAGALDLGAIINRVSESIEEQDTQLTEDAKLKFDALIELKKMIGWGAGLKKSESYDPDRARELVSLIRSINEKYKCEANDPKGIINQFEKFGDKID